MLLTEGSDWAYWIQDIWNILGTVQHSISDMLLKWKRWCEEVPWTCHGTSNCFISDKRRAPHCSLDPCQPHHRPAQLVHKALLVFSSHFLTFPTHSSAGHSLQGKLPDHEITLLFFLSFSCCSDTQLLVLSKSYSDLSCLAVTNILFGHLLSLIFHLLQLFYCRVWQSAFKKLCSWRAVGKTSSFNAWRIYKTIFAARYFNYILMVQEYIMSSLLRREYFLLISMRLSTLQPLFSSFLSFAFECFK